jgi:hypothetical protein
MQLIWISINLEVFHVQKNRKFVESLVLQTCLEGHRDYQKGNISAFFDDFYALFAGILLLLEAEMVQKSYVLQHNKSMFNS